MDIKISTKISVLLEKINYLQLSIQQSGGYVSKVDKDLLINYTRELYDLALAIQVQQPNYQYPPQDKLFVPSYISSDYQTHYGIYKIENGELQLLFQKLQIVFDGLVFYYLERDITNFLHKLGLNKTEIDKIKNTKYKLDVVDL